MPTPKLFVRQFKTKDNKVYMFYRYWDDHNENFEYQVYELIESRNAARNLGAVDVIEGRLTELNTREMCDWVWENVPPLE